MNKEKNTKRKLEKNETETLYNRDICAWKKCNNESDIYYRSLIGICSTHWKQTCEIDNNLSEIVQQYAKKEALDVLRTNRDII